MELGPGDSRQDWAPAVWAPECFHPSSGSHHPTPPTGPSGVCGADPRGGRQRPALRSCGACCLRGKICAKEGEEGRPGCPLRRTGQRSLPDCRSPPSPEPALPGEPILPSELSPRREGRSFPTRPRRNGLTCSFLWGLSGTPVSQVLGWCGAPSVPRQHTSWGRSTAP